MKPSYPNPNSNYFPSLLLRFVLIIATLTAKGCSCEINPSSSKNSIDLKKRHEKELKEKELKDKEEKELEKKELKDKEEKEKKELKDKEQEENNKKSPEELQEALEQAFDTDDANAFQAALDQGADPSELCT